MTDVKPPLEAIVLVHHGIKGMKWGVRRKLKKEGNARTRSFMEDVTRRQQHAFDEISEKEYKSLSSKPIQLGVSGSTFNRVASSSGTSLRDFAYVTRDEQDHIRYKVALNAGGGQQGGQKFDVRVKVTSNIISPSKKERVDTFIKTLDTKITVSDAAGRPQTMTGRKFLEDAGVGSSLAKALNNREFGLKTYGEFAQGQVLGTPIHSAYASALKKKGYNAIVDDADAGMMSRLPIILFPKESGAHVISATPIGRDEMLQARADLELLKDT